MAFPEASTLKTSTAVRCWSENTATDLHPDQICATPLEASVRKELRTGKTTAAAGVWTAIAFRLKTLGAAVHGNGNV